MKPQSLDQRPNGPPALINKPLLQVPTQPQARMCPPVQITTPTAPLSPPRLARVPPLRLIMQTELLRGIIVVREYREGRDDGVLG